ncbi:hypothetical protein ACFXGD_04215 [Streptomyces albidoflavus]
MSLLLTAAFCGAAVYGTQAVVASADRKTSTERWGEQDEPSKDPAERAWEGRHDTELSGLLLPVDEDHRLGPDIGGYGNDVEISDAELVAAAKQSLRGLPQALRRNLEKQIDRSGLEGIAMRSYTENALGVAYEDSEAHAAIRVESLKDRAAAEREHRLVVKSLRAGEGKPAPKIKGHPQAYCHRVDLDMEYGHRQVLCSAPSGKYLVILAGEASTEDAVGRAVELFANQLDHLDAPGKYI